MSKIEEMEVRLADLTKKVEEGKARAEAAREELRKAQKDLQVAHAERNLLMAQLQLERVR